MRRYTGPALMVIGLLHVLVVAVTLSGPIADVVRDGVFDAVNAYDERNVAFWSLWFGVLLFTVGYLVRWTRSHVGTVPALPGWVVLAMGLAGGIMMPASPFWLAVPLGLSILLPPRPARTSAAPSPAVAPGRGGRGAAP